MKERAVNPTMSRYTVEYGTIYDSGFSPLLDCLRTYPLYSESHRADLNKLIYGRYRFREIGFETAAVFVHYFSQLLAEIMPMYNKLYEAVNSEYDIFADADYTETVDEGITTEMTGNASGTSNSETRNTGTDTTTEHNASAHSDTPQGHFDFSLVSNNEYLSTADVSDGTVTTTYNSGSNTDASTSSESETQGQRDRDLTRRIKGKFPGRTYADILKEYSEKILNIDRMVLDELNVCFMGVY